MNYVKIRLVKEKGSWVSGAIGWWGNSHWSHMASVVTESYVIDSRSDHIFDPGTRKYIDPGVQYRPISYMDSMEWLEIQIPTKEGADLTWAQKLDSQKGKPYDFPGIWSMVTEGKDRNWRDESAWFCSELGTWAAEGPVIPHLGLDAYRVFPGECQIWAMAAGGIVTGHHKP